MRSPKNQPGFLRMKFLSDANFRRDLLKILCVFGALLGTAYLFILNPTLSSPTLVSIVITMLLSPLVASVERRGYPRVVAILVIFTAFGICASWTTLWGVQSGQAQWENLKNHAPTYFDQTVEKLKLRESTVKARYPMLATVNPTDTLVNYAKLTANWFVDNGAKLVGDLLTWMFIIPLLSFFLLNDGPNLRRRFFQLVPNRYFELVFGITNEVSTSISDYIRAKLLEALIVGLLVWIGLAVADVPYSFFLALAAGVTNILPYVGPLLGALPGIIIASLETTQPTMIWWTLGVYLIANLVDNVFIFPVIVGKLVDLHPMILIVAVIVGGQYYGLIGMLISIPVASAIKVILQEIYRTVYDHRGNRANNRTSI